MRVLLHIGQSKTGTSAIQAFLTLNRKQLLRQGILYPAVSMRGMTLNLGSHNAVADALVGCRRFPSLSADEYFTQFAQQVCQHKSKLMILSGEHFFAGEPRVWDIKSWDEYCLKYKKKLENLRGYLGNSEVCILLYLRPQVDWLASAASHTIRIEKLIGNRRLYKSDKQFFEMTKPLLRYGDLLTLWETILRPSDLTVVPYERQNLYRRNSVEDFCRRCNLDELSCNFTAKAIEINSSLSRQHIEVKKILNRKPRTNAEERVVIRILEKLTARSPDCTPYQLKQEVSEEVERFAKDQNLLVNEKYIKKPLVLVASTRRDAPLTPLSKKLTRAALSDFVQERRKWKYGILKLMFHSRSWLRQHAKTVQAALHQLKMPYWRLKVALRARGARSSSNRHS